MLFRFAQSAAEAAFKSFSNVKVGNLHRFSVEEYYCGWQVSVQRYHRARGDSLCDADSVLKTLCSFFYRL